MNNTKTGSSNITTKIRSSLVLKLNTRMVLRLLSAFLAINVLIIIMGTFVIFWNAEEGVKAVIDMVELTPLDSKLINRNIGKYIVSEDI
ncbi:MAG: sensor histidine kinase, partial [Clostridiales bacterium]|nr:sensor histidine kinase [Clostridiales bacterium]